LLVEENIIRDDDGSRTRAVDDIALLVHVKTNKNATDAALHLLSIRFIRGGPFAYSHGTSKGSQMADTWLRTEE